MGSRETPPELQADRGWGLTLLHGCVMPEENYVPNAACRRLSLLGAFGGKATRGHRTHSAAMTVLAAFAGREQERNSPLKAATASRLLRAYAAQVETLRRWNNGGSQVVRVEHVHVNEGGQALIGNVRKDGGGKDRSPTLDLDSSSQQV